MAADSEPGVSVNSRRAWWKGWNAPSTVPNSLMVVSFSVARKMRAGWPLHVPAARSSARQAAKIDVLIRKRAVIRFGYMLQMYPFRCRKATE